MDITYLGHSSFRLKSKTATLITDPFDPKMVGLSFPKISADIVTVSHDHDDHNKTELVKDIKRVVDGPGEYEINEVSIIGISSFHDDKKGKTRGRNTIYILEIEGLRLAHLGDLGHKLSERMVEKIGDIDILMIPIGGEYTIDASVAAQIVRDIEPKLIIPMHFKTPKLNPQTFSKLTTEEPFLKELGLPVEKTNKLTVTVSSIGEDQKIILLEAKQ
jgi:L-ascorbate metabolism protein UlaG (beta-lactamase superfamily)